MRKVAQWWDFSLAEIIRHCVLPARDENERAEHRRGCATRLGTAEGCGELSLGGTGKSLLGASLFVLSVMCILLAQMCTKEQFTEGKKT